MERCFSARSALVPQRSPEPCDTASSAGIGAQCFPTKGRTPLRGRQKTFWLHKGFSPAKPFCCLNSTPHPGRVRAALASIFSQPSWLHIPAGKLRLGESLWNWGVKLGDAAVSSSCVGASCLLCIPVLPLPGALPQAAIPQENLSRMSLAVVKARSVLSHPPVTDSRSLCPAPPHPLHLPLHLFQAQQALGFSSPSARLFPVLGQGFLQVISSSHELAAGGNAVPVLCQPLPQLLPDPAHPCPSSASRCSPIPSPSTVLVVPVPLSSLTGADTFAGNQSCAQRSPRA